MAFLGEEGILALSSIFKELGNKFFGVSQEELNKMIRVEETLEKIGLVKRLTISKNRHKPYFPIMYSGKSRRIMVRYYLGLKEENLLSKQFQVTNPNDYLLWEKARETRRKRSIKSAKKKEIFGDRALTYMCLATTIERT